MSKKEVVTIDYVALKNELQPQLTKRNEQYIHDLDKALALANISEEKRTALAVEMMEKLIVAQKSGQTARQLFGTVSEQVKAVLEGPGEDLTKPSESWKLYIDGALLMGSLFMLLSGISANNNPLGITTLILNYVIAGFAMLIVSKASPQFQSELRQTGSRWKSMAKYMGTTLLAMGLWVVGILLVTLIPPVINPVLPQMTYFIIGASTLALKFYLKKALHIRGGMF